MEPDRSAHSDMDLRTHILTGLLATAELEARFRKPLERYLVSLCDRGDGRSHEKAVEIAGQVLAECFVKTPSLLERWQGGENLEAFLRTVAVNRLKSWWSSAEKTRTEVNSESLSLAHATMPESAVDREEAGMAAVALRAGVAAATKDCPEGLVFLRLKGLFGVDQRVISQCWGHHEAQTSRRIKEAMDVIRKTASEIAVSRDCELSMDILRQALHRDPDILLGCTSGPGTEGDTMVLKQLAAGVADAATKRRAVEMMCLNSRMLGIFAQILNHHDEPEVLVMKDPALSGMAARVGDCLRRTLEILHPSEAAGLVSPGMMACFADLLAHAGADGGTLWLLCPGSAALEAVFNPLEPEIAGKRQPLVSGIVSLVLATGEPACVSGVEAHSRHSPAIDIALGKTTHSMIAVPVILAGAARGVLTAVRFKRHQPFGESETHIVARYADILASHMVHNLTAKILG